MTAWTHTEDGWAVNLDGTDAAREFTLPRIELHSGPHGWTGVCHLADGTTRPLAIGPASTAAEARRIAVEHAAAALGATYAPALRKLV